MAYVISLKPAQLGPAIRQRLKSAPFAVHRGMKNAAARGKSLLVRRTPKDRGQAKAAWRVVHGGKAFDIDLMNDAPYIGVLEHGARPHHLNREGIVAVAGWFRRKFGLPEKEALSAAHGFSKNLAKRGQPPRYFVRGAMDDLHRMVAQEVQRALDKHSSQRRPS